MTKNRLARGRSVRAWLGIVSLVTLSCGPTLVEDEKYSGEKALRRWSLTRAQKGKLAEGCRVWPDFPSFPSPAVPNDTYPAVKVGFVANDPLIYEDDLGCKPSTAPASGSRCRLPTSSGARNSNSIGSSADPSPASNASPSSTPNRQSSSRRWI